MLLLIVRMHLFPRFPRFTPLMFSVTKRIDFCYGHRLLNYDGVSAAIRTGTMPWRKSKCRPPSSTPAAWSATSRHQAHRQGWIDDALDHKMILRRDDPLVDALRSLGEPVFLVDTNPTAECLAEAGSSTTPPVSSFPSCASPSGKRRRRPTPSTDARDRASNAVTTPAHAHTASAFVVPAHSRDYQPHSSVRLRSRWNPRDSQRDIANAANAVLEQVWRGAITGGSDCRHGWRRRSHAHRSRLQGCRLAEAA